ncbi:hypothetical protein EPN29_00065 [bacterium]|nr:MAG: hypothetical protein EPN29_00065 [bacterium]
MSRRWLTYGATVAGLVVAAIVAVLAFQALHVPLQSSTRSGPTPVAACAPAPCANVQGYTLWVSNVNVVGAVVSMQVTFRNSSDATHASPEDLQLVDSNHHVSGLITGPPGCATWARHEFSNGARFGPLNVCFRVSTATPPLILRWSPDLGVFCCQAEIMLTEL